MFKVDRKRKKRIKKAFGEGTYRALVEGYLTIVPYNKNRGVITEYFYKPMVDVFYYSSTFNPYLSFRKYRIYY